MGWYESLFQRLMNRFIIDGPAESRINNLCCQNWLQIFVNLPWFRPNLAELWSDPRWLPRYSPVDGQWEGKTLSDAPLRSRLNSARVTLGCRLVPASVPIGGNFPFRCQCLDSSSREPRHGREMVKVSEIFSIISQLTWLPRGRIAHNLDEFLHIPSINLSYNFETSSVPF